MVIVFIYLNFLTFSQDKKSLTLGPDDNLYVEGFASNLFAKADKQDRAGRADLYVEVIIFYFMYVLQVNEIF